MANDFLSQLHDTLTDSSDNVSVTENGALGYKTTGKNLLDMNFAVSSLRNKADAEIQEMFKGVLAENVNTAIVYLFFLRDVRGGLGERRSFRVCLQYLAGEYPDKVRKIMPLISEYGRWDDLFCLIDTKVQNDMFALIRLQLTADLKNMVENKNISLLAKWLPSVNASSRKTRVNASLIASKIGLRERDYQKMLSIMRRYLGVVEKKMSSGEWDRINYEHVPSRANLNYNGAFLRHDEQRRREYLEKLERGETKINSSALFPHDIVHKYVGSSNYYFRNPIDADPAIEAMWKSLPNTVKDGEGTIVVADGSGSMNCTISGTSVTALDVANALAIYFAERLPEPFKDRYITFSSHPKLVNLGGSTTLACKLNTALTHNEVANTNIEAVFDLILSTAIRNNLKQNQLPRNILIISDMEFDHCVSQNGWYCGISDNLFSEIGRRFAQHGYQLPRLVFWNVMSRTGTIPVKANANGVALVSGFSPNIAKMVMSGRTDPMDALMDMLNVPRYDAVREALAS